MDFSIEEKRYASLAMDTAIQWELSLIEAHSTCNDEDSDELRKKCNDNIDRFRKLKKRFDYAAKCSITHRKRYEKYYNDRGVFIE